MSTFTWGNKDYGIWPKITNLNNFKRESYDLNPGKLSLKPKVTVYKGQNKNSNPRYSLPPMLMFLTTTILDSQSL